MYARRRASLFVALASASTPTAEALAAAPRLKMVLDSATAEHGVQTLSLVQNPAIQRGWVALSAVEAQPAKRFHLSEASEGTHKQVITGPALVPGQEILRLDEKGEPYFIVFDAATIEATARRFAAQGHHNSTNQDHATALSGNVVYESWIVADSEKDKAAALGLSVEPGMWMLSVHIPDSDYWQNEVVSGNKTGFSIEGLFSSEQLTLSAAKPTALSTVKNWFTTTLAKLTAIGGEKAAEIRAALGLEQLADGRSVSIDDTTGAVSVVDADGNSTPLADGSYPLAGGGELVVEGGLRKAAEPTTDEAAPNLEGDGATATAPAPLAADAGLPDVVKAINDLISNLVKAPKVAENPASAPAAPKLAAVLHGLKLEGLTAKLTELKLDAIELVAGDSLTYNPVTRQLRDSKNALVETGYYAAADGSYFNVSTDQYIYEISKQTYDAVYGANLQAVELADVKALLAKAPAALRLSLGGDSATNEPEEETRTSAQIRLAAARARQQKAA
jgi:hypothetical protein